MNIYSIYKVTNIINNKIYIGYTSKSLNERKQQHINQANKKARTRFHIALIKYGIENFIWECIFQSLDQIYCKQLMEPHFIEEFDSYYSGYNDTKGGDGVSSETIKNIRADPDSVYNSKEYKDKRSNIQKEVRRDPESKFNSGDFRQKVSSNMKRMWDNPESTFNSDEYRKKLSAGASLFWAKRKGLVSE